MYYIYAYIRSRDTEIAKAGTPYYIGKGKGQRAWSKSGHAKNNVTVPKNKQLIVIMEDNLTEVGAYALERFYIRWHGKEMNGGILRNIADGGEGSAGPITAQHRNNISKARTGKKYGKLTEEHRSKIGQANKKSQLKYKYDIECIKTSYIFHDVSMNEFCRERSLTDVLLRKTLPESWTTKKITQHKGYRILKKEKL